MLRLGTVLLLPALLLPRTCTVNLGGGTPDSPGEVKLGVPYVAQQDAYACGPASILMWALYDGRTNVTQAQIAQYVGCSTGSGTLLDRLAPGVRAFTDATDAVLESAGSSLFFARQISSIGSRDPVLSVVNAGTHAGILEGGHWHATDSGLNVWDYVYFHDPLVAADRRFEAADWTGLVNYHVVSASSAANGQEGLSTYGSSVRVRGSDGSIGGPILKEER
ncbi:MAG: Peptidase like family [Acidobacteriota bacterium]|jgi:hypothetical protein|nr:Peptidase like family [Acidobacteriota bacterium]